MENRSHYVQTPRGGLLICVAIFPMLERVMGFGFRGTPCLDESTTSKSVYTDGGLDLVGPMLDLTQCDKKELSLTSCYK